MRKQIAYIVTFLLMAFSFNVSAQEKSDAEGEKAFNPKEAIFEHLLDGYGWELPFSHEHRIPLPVIVRDYKGDWQVFLSSRLGHGQQYKGFYIAQEGPNKGKVESVDDQGNRYRPLDLSITKNVLALFIAAFVCAWCVLSVARWYKRKRYKAPRKGVGAIEFRFAPYLLTAFVFILLMNLLGLIVIFPGGANLTGNIAVTMVMALCTFIVVNVRGTKEYWKEIFWPDVPLWLKFPLPIMPLIEVFGIFTKPAALMVRLFANMMGGHMIILSLISLIFIFSAFGAVVVGATTVVSVLFSLFMLLIDTLVSFIQAYVFTMLSTLFISLAQVEEHHEKEKVETK